MLQSWITQLGAAAVVLVCLYALTAGSWRERFGAAIYLLAYLLSLGFGLTSIRHTTWYLLVADTICLLGFYMVCWKAPHPWPKWALLAQFLCVTGEIATLFNIGIESRWFLMVETIAGWGVLIALLLGTIAAAQARRTLRRIARP